jgi:hypothetical protein
MQLFAASPEGNNEICFDEQTQVFGNALARHAKMTAKLVESLAVVLVELIEEGAPAWVGEGFEDIVHGAQLCNQMVACQPRLPRRTLALEAPSATTQSSTVPHRLPLQV